MQYQAIRKLADVTHGVISSETLLRHVHRNTVSNWIAKGWLVEIAPRSYAFVDRPTWRQQLHAIYLSSPNLVVSHRASATLWDISPFRFHHLEFVCAPGEQPRIDNATIHETNFLPRRYIRWIEGTPVTSPAMTLVMLSAVWREKMLMKALTRALDKGRVTLGEVQRTRDAVARRGRRRTTLIDQVLAHPKFEDPKNRSDLERDARLLLKQAKLPEPVAQHAVVFEHFTLHPDLAYPEIGLAIEIDSYDYHGRTEEAFDDDKERDAFLSINGWRVERFSPNTMHLLVPVVSAFFARKHAS